ncbi:MAG: cell division protein SepF [Acholeplasmataceae bacterium]|nr:cell division protein SepF [Acholeplasmataceae bacterium]
MALFSKLKKEDVKLPNYQSQPILTAFERIIFEEANNDEDKYIVDLATELVNGNPLVINFEHLPAEQANKIVAFLSGVIFAADGRIEQINKKIFLFARNQEFKDGTLQRFIDEYKE